MDLVGTLFIIRLVFILFVGFVATRNRNYIGMLVMVLHICTTTVNYSYQNPSLNAIFSTPLVFLTAWYIIKDNRRIRAVKKHEELVVELKEM